LTTLTLVKWIIDVARLRVRGRTDFNVVYLGSGRSTPGPLRKPLQRSFFAGHYGLNAAVTAISNPPCKPQATRLVAHRPAKPDALHVAGNSEMKRGQLHDPA
jgi:hypothetical protein